MNTNEFIQKPVRQLFFHYLIPAICGTMVTSIYVLADTIFIGKQLGATALAALNISLPIYNIFFGLGLLSGVGGSVLMSICRGKSQKEEGNTYFTTALLLNFALLLISMTVCVLFMEDIAWLLGGTEETLPYIMDYLFVYPMNMGMKGAALATVLGSSLTVVILCTHFFTKKNQLKFTLKGFHPSFLQKIIANGFTSFVIEAASGFTIFIFNLQLIRYLGNTGVSVYGIICNTALVVICLCKGIEQAAQPILSINHGAGLSSRILKVQSLSLKTSVIICTLPVLLGLFVPNLFTYIFLEPTSEILTLAAPAIRIYFTGFLFLGINMVFICYFQSVAKSVQSLSLCLLRGCILVVAFVYILPVFFGSTGIWLAFPAAEFLTMIVGICFYRQDLKAY